MRVRHGLRTTLACAAWACAWAVGPVGDARAASGNADKLLARMTASERRTLERTAALSAPALQDIAAGTSPDRLRERTAEILALGSLAPGSRTYDTNGLAPVHRYLMDRIGALAPRGVEFLGELRATVAVPVPAGERGVDGTAASVTVGDRSWGLYPLWPNGAMPSLCPEGGLTGRLIDVGLGRWEDVKGLDLDGAIALMDFGGSRNWDRLFMLGARAVIVLDDDLVSRVNAVPLFCNTPAPFPRFYAGRATAAALREATRAASVAATPAVARVEGGHVLANRRVTSLFAYLPPTAPIKVEVRPSDLLDRIALENGVAAADILGENRLTSPVLQVGQRLDIPGKLDPYTVREGDLMLRLAAEYGIAPHLILNASGLLPAGERPETPPDPPAGTVLTIPNVDDSLVLACRIDSVCVAPDAPHGAAVAANLAVVLTLMENLAGADGVRRRMGVVVAFLDGDNHGGAASRALAERILLDRGELKSAVSQAAEAGSGMYRFFAILLGTALFGAAGLLLARILARRWSAAAGAPAPRWMRVGVPVGAFALGILAGALVPLAPSGSGPAGGAQSTESVRLDDYASVLAWMRDPASVALNDTTARWLVEEWLATRFETVRVSLAEDRIALVLAQQAGETNALTAGRLAKVDRAIRDVAAVRDETFGDVTRSWGERTARFRARLGGEAADLLNEYGLGLASLTARLEAEYAEERSAIADQASNTAAVQNLLARLHPLEGDDQERDALNVPGWLIDLSDGGTTLTTDVSRDGRGMGLPAHPAAVGLVSKHFLLAAYAGTTAGWPEQWPFIGGGRYPEFSVIARDGQIPAYAEFLLPAQVSLAAMQTVNDNRLTLDTPRDTAENTRFENLAVQARTALLFLRYSVENPVESGRSGMGRPKPEQFSRLVGKAVEFNIRSGIDAQQPVPGAYVYYPACGRQAASGVYAANSAALMGSRPGIVRITRLNGTYALPPESLGYGKKLGLANVYAYRLDRAAALFDMVMDQAAIGTQKQKPAFDMVSGRDVEKKPVLTPLYPRVLFADVDPTGYGGIPNPKANDASSIQIFDAVLNGPPRHVAVDSPAVHYKEADLSTIVVYVPKGRQARVVFDDKGTTKALLIGRFANEKDDKGMGYLVGPTPEGDRNVALHLTPVRIAEGMLQVAEKRRDQYHAYGIRDQAVDQAIRLAAEKMALCRGHLGRRDWQAAVGMARECWGILIKNYPTVMRLGRESVFSVVFLMGLLVPAAAFLERLVIGSRSILMRLLGATIIFSLGTLFLKVFHPAFEIAVSPFIVVIAFVMILMSVFVLGLLYQRFEVLVRRARIAGGEAESEEISLSSSLQTAMSLGVSNLKKRPTRTVLTAFTVSVLTFSIITFVSVRGKDRLMRQDVSLDRDVEGVAVEPEPPPYDGVLFRRFNWASLDSGYVSALQTEYGTRFDLAARGFYVEASGGNNADREGVNQIEVAAGKRSAIVNGVMTLAPEETEFTGLNRAVSHGAWFGETDRFHVILPARVAAAMGVTADQLVDASGRRRPDAELPEVRMLSNRWRVIGILDAGRADRMRDVNGKSLALVDYLRSGATPNASGLLEQEGVTYHVSWDRLAIVPAAALSDVGGRWYSVAVRFKPGDDVEGFCRDIALRTDAAMFGHIDGKLSLLSSRKERSVGGLAKIIVPIILCILIVANTMMGAVEERKGEVQMLGAVGLSPAQISFLLMSEAAVFSVLGIVFGMFAGLAFSMIMLGHPDVLGGLSFNFTSLASTALAMSTGLIVLMATLVPARRAAALAAPSGMGKWALPQPGEDGRIRFHLPFTLTRGNAVGMLAFFRRFMLNHTDATSQDFNCRDVAVAVVRAPSDRLVLGARMWLAPYDLDVAQDMEMAIEPTANAGVFRASLTLHRTSGSEESWLRTNYHFLDLVRLQFLLWRNLGGAMRRPYIETGAELIRQAGTPTVKHSG